MKLLICSIFIALCFFSPYEAVASEYSMERLVSALPSSLETIVGANNLTETLPGSGRNEYNLFSFLLPHHYFEKECEVGCVGFMSTDSVDGFVQGFQFIRSHPIKEIEEINICAIYLLKPDAISSVQESLIKHARSEAGTGKSTIWCFNLEEGKLGGYFCFVDRRLLIFSSKKSFVLDIVSQLYKKRKNSIVNEWTELRDIDLNSNYFAVRHYQKKQNVRYWSDGDLAFVQDRDVIGFSLVSDSLKWNKVKINYHSKFPISFDKYLKSVSSNPVYPSKKSFQYRMLSNKRQKSEFELTADSEDARGNMYFTFPLLFGFVPI